MVQASTRSKVHRHQSAAKCIGINSHQSAAPNNSPIFFDFLQPKMGILGTLAEAILLGFQHYLVMLGTTVIIPTPLVPQMGGGNEEKARVIWLSHCSKLGYLQ